MHAYLTLVESASKLTSVNLLDDIYKGDTSRASVFLQANADVISLAREQLTLDCCVPLRFEESFLSDHGDDILHIRNLARALKLELLHRKQCRQIAQAVASGVDMLRMANAFRRGGLVLNLLTATTIEGLALDGLRGLRKNLTNDDRIKLITDLLTLENQREPYADVATRDHDWEVAVGYCSDTPVDMSSWATFDPDECGLTEAKQLELRDFVEMSANLPQSERNAMHLDLDRKMVAMSRLLRMELSLQCIHETSGSYPSTLLCDVLADPSATSDPFTNDLFIYRRIDRESFVLYSPGPTKIDHGGKFGSWLKVAAGKADPCLDESDYDA